MKEKESVFKWTCDVCGNKAETKFQKPEGWGRIALGVKAPASVDPLRLPSLDICANCYGVIAGSLEQVLYRLGLDVEEYRA